MDLYNAQRTNFQPGAPRLAGKPGMQRQTTQRSGNRGKASMPKGAMPVPPGGGAAIPAGAKRPMPPGVVPQVMPGGAKKPMPPMPGGVVGPKKKSNMPMLQKMAAFRPGE